MATLGLIDNGTLKANIARNKPLELNYKEGLQINER